MGNRLSKIYTRTGDKGTTGLGDGTRVDKDDLRVETFGTVDELNSLVGMVLAGELDDAVRTCLTRTQHELFDLGGELCMPGYTLVPEDCVDQLENDLDRFNKDLPPLKDFILPGGSKASSYLHIARTVSRRAEREMITVNQVEFKKIGSPALKYINRLSDLLFVACRYANLKLNKDDILWVPGANR